MNHKKFELDSRLANDTVILGEFDLSLLLMNKDSRYPWFILVPKRAGITELFQLSEKDQQQLLKESSSLSEALYEHLNADKMNVAALGNMVPQLHLHHIARFTSDDAWPGPMWGQHPAIPFESEDLARAVDTYQQALLDRDIAFRPSEPES